MREAEIKPDVKPRYIDPTAIIDRDVLIGAGTRIWHFTHISEGARIGENCIIGQNVFVGKNVEIGEGCKLQNGVNVFEGVTLGDHVFIGPSATFTNVKRPRADIEQKDRFLKTRIESYVSIGANATILPGIAIGYMTIVGAGAVVTKSFGVHLIIAGNPARIIQLREI